MRSSRIPTATRSSLSRRRKVFQQLQGIFQRIDDRLCVLLDCLVLVRAENVGTEQGRGERVAHVVAEGRDVLGELLAGRVLLDSGIG